VACAGWLEVGLTWRSVVEPAGPGIVTNNGDHGGREAVHTEVLRAREPVHPGDIAARLGLHLSTVRRHLEVLESAGRIERCLEPRELAGRPRVTYRPAGVPGGAAGLCNGYHFVAEALAQWVEHTADDPREAATQVGEAWGRHLVNAPPFARTTREGGLARLFALLEDLGYAPTREADDGDTLELGRCPFPGLTEEHPDIGCGLHLGIVRGALASLGAPVEVGEAEMYPGEPDAVCRLELLDGAVRRPSPG
jgi:predicted ArsR family transcriptional regulator